MKFYIFLAIIMLSGIACAFSDKTASAPQDLPDADRLLLGYGAITLDQENGLNRKIWYEYRIKPRFHMRKIWLGLDFRLHLDENNKLYADEWNGWNDVIDKIDYLYFNDKTDSIFFRAGELREVTFGSGFVVNRYSNVITYPIQKRKVGLDLGLNFPYEDGMEIFVNDIDASRLFGMRLYFVPLDGVNVGFSYIRDKDPERNNDSSGSLHFFAADLISPLYKKAHSGFYVYENAAKILDYGFGVSSGAKWEMPILELAAEYRYYDADFAPSYFNEFYELDSRRKFNDLKALKQSGKFGGFYYSTLLKLLDNAVQWRSSLEQFTKSGQGLHFFSELKLKNLPVTDTDCSISYDDKDAYLANFGFDKRNVAIIGAVTYKIAKNAQLKFDYKRIYDEFGVAQKVSGISTDLIF
ncbi:MAG: hypothetical protein PHW04_18140 [Candidatus Wallbacteria bacterium]|nr:hypothetical protein [Candidatus Wallbacteria bacterium]